MASKTETVGEVTTVGTVETVSRLWCALHGRYDCACATRGGAPAVDEGLLPEPDRFTVGARGYPHDDERCAWQHASGLIGGSGDPGDITPAMLERHVAALSRVATAAREWRAAVRHERESDVMLAADEAARERYWRDELDAALAALPEEE